MANRLHSMKTVNTPPITGDIAAVERVKPMVSIVIPTLYRLEMLKASLNTAIKQNTANFTIEIVVADNSVESTAKQIVEDIKRISPFPIKYISVPKPGVSNARNAALIVSEGDYIAYLDDDQEADPNWLLHMMEQSHKTGAAVVFSQILGRSETVLPNQKARLDFFSRVHGGAPSGIIDKFYGCGASLLNLNKIDADIMNFDTSRNETGGEDDHLFSTIQKSGGTFAWSKEAVIHENIPADRLSKRYIAVRSFAYGQGPSRICLQKETFSLLGLLRWMVIGIVQMGIFLPLALLSWPFETEFHMKALRKGCEGAGKFFWQTPFRPRLYGQAAVNKLKKQKNLKSANLA